MASKKITHSNIATAMARISRTSGQDLILQSSNRTKKTSNLVLQVYNCLKHVLQPGVTGICMEMLRLMCSFHTSTHRQYRDEQMTDLTWGALHRQDSPRKVLSVSLNVTRRSTKTSHGLDECLMECIAGRSCLVIGSWVGEIILLPTAVGLEMIRGAGGNSAEATRSLGAA